MNIFAIGEYQNLQDIMKSREHRALMQKRLLEEYKNPLISFKLNIVGPIKNNLYIEQIFQSGVEEILQTLEQNNIKLLHIHTDKSPSSDEAYIVFESDSMRVKKLMCHLENKDLKTRLYDIDIIKEDGESISRTSLGFLPRKCLICEEDAVLCARSRKHSLEHLQETISKIYTDHFQ